MAMQRVKSKSSNALIVLFRTMQGNQKVNVYIEPLFGIPFTLIAPFTTLYMYAMGISDVQIGVAVSVAMLVKVVFAFMGGIIVDKLGRKRVTVAMEIIIWMIPCLIYAFATQYWHFLIAMMLNAMEPVCNVSWNCLFIEDAKKKDVLGLYMWVTVAAQLAVFFSPITGILIKNFSIVPVIRCLYAIFALSQMTKAILTGIFTVETARGLERIRETKGVPLRKMIGNHRQLIPQIFKNSALVKVLLVMAIVQITTMISSNFVSLYAGETLMIPKQMLSYFPIMRAGVMLVFIFFIQNILQRFSIRGPMLLGLVIYIGAQAALVLGTRNSIALMLLYTFLESVAYALVVPRKDAIMANCIEPGDRARTVAVLNAIMLAFSFPFGYIAGQLSRFDRRLPFVLSAALFLCAIVVMIPFREGETQGAT